MNFISFTTMMKEEIMRRMEEASEVRVNEVIKNNGVVLTGLTVMEEDQNISPTIYLNDYYDAFVSGKMDETEIAEDILLVYRRHKVKNNLDVEFFTDFSCMRDRVIMKLIHAQMNEELLKDVPYISFQNLAVVFQCMVEHQECGNATILIHNAHMKLWNITVEELYQYALENTMRYYPCEIRSMKDVLLEMADHEDINKEEIIEFTRMPGYVPMYVLSNKGKLQGATSMLYPNVLRDFGISLGRNFYILPSSIHEVLLVPEQGDEVVEEMKNMVREINCTQVEVEEVLSNSVYFYNVKENKLITY